MATFLVIYSDLELSEVNGEGGVSFDLIETHDIKESLIDRVVDPGKYGWPFGPFILAFSAIADNVIVIPVPDEIESFDDFLNFGPMLQDKFRSIEAGKRLKESEVALQEEYKKYLELKAKFEGEQRLKNYIQEGTND